jgi:tripartite ATP-independent transporter DctM subunit
MPQAGLLMLVAAGALMLLSGLPAYGVLMLVSVAAAAFGVVTGTLDAALLGALPGRVVGLLEQDLLQAVPLFVLVGTLLDRLPLAAILYRGAARLAGGHPASGRLAALALGALLAPMNGAVGASVSLLSRVVGPRLAERGVAPADRVACVAGASALGVLVPPSLVLLLLGDALMAAHTEAVNATGRNVRIVNTQDLLLGALIPAGLVLLFGIVAVFWQARRAPTPAEEAPLSGREKAAAALTLTTLLALLGGVAIGRFHAVEAAATGGVLLFVAAGVTRQIDLRRLQSVLEDALATSGALLALFIAATTFTLLLRAYGTDRWLIQLFDRWQPGPAQALAVVLGAILLCGLVLDAFEMIFVLVPVLMPPLLMRVDDAAWAGVLVLMALQASFLVPPMGYAVMMAASRTTPAPHAGALVRALAPWLVAQALALAIVLAWPQLTHPQGQAQEATPAKPQMSEDEIERLMREAPGGRDERP